MSIRKQAIKGVFWTGLQQFGSQGIGFVVSITLARMIAPSEFGIFGLLAVFLALGTTITNAGMGSSLIRTKMLGLKDYNTVFWFSLIMGIVLYIVLFISAPIIGSFYEQPLLVPLARLSGLVLIINSLYIVQQAILSKELNFKSQFFISLPALIISSLLGVILAYNGFGIWSLVWMNIVQSFIIFVFYFFTSKWKPKFIFSKKKFKLHFGFGVKMMLSGIIDTIFTNIYVLIIGKSFPISEVAYYNRAESLKQLPVANIGAILNKVTYPLFASIKDDLEQLKSLYKKLLKIVIYLVTPILSISVVLANPLFSFLLGEQWLPAVPYFQILCLNGLLYPIHSYNLNILEVMGRSDLFLKLEVFKKLILIVVLIISFYFGIYGLLWGSVLFSILCLIINNIYAGRFIKYKLSEQLLDIIPYIILGVVVAGLLFLLEIQFLNEIQTLGIRLMLGTVIYLIVYLGLSFFLRMEPLFELIKIIRRK